MRITFVLPFAGLSGGVRVVASYAEQLQRRGHDVLIVSTPQSRASLRDSLRQLVKGQGWPKPPAVLPSHLDRSDVPHHVIERAGPIMDRDVPPADVIVATWWETAEWVAAMSPEKGAKAYFIQQFEANFGMPEARVARTWQLPMHKIVCSQWLADFARQRFGETICSVTPNGVDLELFHAAPRGKQAVPTVGMMYATNPVKGCDLSLAALHQVKQRFSELRLLAFGEQEPVPSLPLPSWSQYTFHPAQESLRELYGQCDAWLCGSRSEGFHLPPHEAMACRCPVVSTRVGGPMDMIEEGINGHLVDTGDSDGLAGCVQKVLSMTDDAWRRMSEAALATAQRFNWRVAGERFERALELAVQRAARSEIAGNRSGIRIVA